MEWGAQATQSCFEVSRLRLKMRLCQAPASSVGQSHPSITCSVDDDDGEDDAQGLGVVHPTEAWRGHVKQS
jgi:hypothetical protein